MQCLESAPLRQKGGTLASRGRWSDGLNPGEECADITPTMTDHLLLAEACQPTTSLTQVFEPTVRWTLRDRLSRRKWPLIVLVPFVAIGLLYLFEWNVLVHHAPLWAVGGDLWGIYRGAHYIGWGSLGGIYTSGTGIVAFPGMAVLLSPVALITWHLHMTESYGPFVLAHPSAALVLQPIELLLASTVIFASDALAERLGVVSRRRLWLCVAVAVIAWPTAALWGHAEDSLAVAFALYAMVAMLDQKWAAMGWLFGFGIVMQPLVGLMLPLFLAATPQGQRVVLLVRSAVISVILVGVAFLGDASDTYRQLVQQPTPPSVNHATPWAALSPKLTSGAIKTVHGASLARIAGHATLHAYTVTGAQVVEVSGGPGRMIGVILAILVGAFVWRRPQSPSRVLWLAAVVLSLRCFFEPVMTPYYLAPPLFMCLILAARQSRRRFWPSVVIALEITVFAYFHLNPWVWWLPIVTGLTAILALGYPNDQRTEHTGPAPVGTVPAPLERVVIPAESIGVTVSERSPEPALR